jgi:hypothetical protein
MPPEIMLIAKVSPLLSPLAVFVLWRIFFKGERTIDERDYEDTLTDMELADGDDAQNAILDKLYDVLRRSEP